MKPVHRRRPASLLDLEVGKIPPQAPELEQAVLGATMLYRDALTKLSSFLEAEHFYVEAHKAIYKAQLHLLNSDEPIDILTVIHRLKATAELDIVGGAFYISQLTNKATGAAASEAHARIVVQCFMKRQLIATSANTMRDAYDDSVDVFDLLDQHNEGMASVNSIVAQKDPDNAAVIVDAMVKNRNKDHYIHFGMSDLDTHVAMGPGCVCVVGARPAVGKTTFVINGLINMAKAGHRSLFLSLEMNQTQLSAKIMSILTGIDSETITRNDITEEQRATIATAAAYNGVWIPRILINDLASLRASQVAGLFEQAAKRHQCSVVVIDYLQLMDGEGDGPTERMSNISKSCKQAAKASGLRLIEVSQLKRRDGADVNPEMSDLRESGQIEADGDIIILLGRPMGSQELTAKIAKNKMGPIGKVTIPFNLITQGIGWAPLPHPDNRIEQQREQDEPAPF